MKRDYLLAGLYMALEKTVEKKVFENTCVERDTGWIYVSRHTWTSRSHLALPLICVRPGRWLTPETLSLLQPLLRFASMGCTVLLVIVYGDPPEPRGLIGRLLDMLRFSWRRRVEKYAREAAKRLPGDMIEVLRAAGDWVEGAWRDGERVRLEEFPAERPARWSLLVVGDAAAAVLCGA